MPVTYRVSNVGQNYETPPYSRHEPHQGYYEPMNKSPHQNQNYYGSINRSPHQDQGYYYDPIYRGTPYQDQGYFGPLNRDSHQNQGYYGPMMNMGSHQNQGNYRPINKGPYPDQSFYGPIKRSPYQDQGYNGPTNRTPYYYQDLDYDSDMSDNDYGGGYVINNPPQPYMQIPREESQISDTIEWKETPEAHVYKAYLPGIKLSDVEVEVEEDIIKVLNIKFYKGVEYSGQRVQEVHSVILPDNANTEKVGADMENGVLTVTVLKLTRFMKASRSRRNI